MRVGCTRSLHACIRITSLPCDQIRHGSYRIFSRRSGTRYARAYFQSTAILSIEQCATALEWSQKQAPRFLAWLVLGLFAGVRLNELDRLKWGDLDLDAGRLRIDAAASKVRQRRIVHLEPAAREWLYDMHGKVAEWCQDLLDWDHRQYPGGAVVDPQGPTTGSDRVMRGCCSDGQHWTDEAWGCRSAYRSGSRPGYDWVFWGFRAVLAPGQ